MPVKHRRHKKLFNVGEMKIRQKVLVDADCHIETRIASPLIGKFAEL
jgi:hypothetical protein